MATKLTESSCFTNLELIPKRDKLKFIGSFVPHSKDLAKTAVTQCKGVSLHFKPSCCLLNDFH